MTPAATAANTLEHVDSATLDRALASLCDRVVPNRRRVDYVDLNAVARLLGAADVLYRATRMHGFTEWTARGAVVQLSMARTEGRRRMVLAHECGHLLLNPIFDEESIDTSAGVIENLRNTSRGFLAREELVVGRAIQRLGMERVCDMFAAELLLPLERARAMVPRDISVPQLRAMADQLHVSLSLLVHQSNRAGARLRFIRLAKGAGDRWVVVDCAGATKQYEISTVLDPTACREIDSARVAADKEVRVTLSAPGCTPTHARLVRFRASAIALLD